MQIWLFRIIALLLPFLLLLLAEMSLRLLLADRSVPLFIPNPANPAYLVTEPDITRRYFAAASPRPNVKIEPGFVLKDKPDNSIRLVVQGGSTAAGFPYGAGASIAGMLEQRLRRTLPDTPVEVVNTALSAVNSYTLLDLSDDILTIQPDAVLIYAGHNEYLGLLGVGSSYLTSTSPGATLLWLKLRKLYLYQLLEQGYYRFFSTTPEPAGNSRTVMATVARHKDIELDSERYQAGLAQFEQNMRLLLQRYQKAGVPVYLSTVASNLATLAPFNSLPLTAEQDATLTQLEQQLDALPAADAPKLMLPQLAQLTATPSLSANWHYRLGRLYLTLQQSDSAREHLTRARDLDLLRFRAPSAINDIIRTLAKDYDVILVDNETALAKHSAQSVIGDEMMLEHVHPTIAGYFVLADSFYQALYQHKQFGVWKRPVPPAIAWQERPLLPAEEFAGEVRIAQLKADYPFSATPQAVSYPAATEPQQQLGLAYVQGKLDWLSMQRQSALAYQQQKDGDMLLKTLKILADALPHDGTANLQAAQILLQAKRYGEARFYLQRAQLTANPPPMAAQLLQQLSRN